MDATDLSTKSTYEEKIRSAPLPSVGAAVAAGFVLSRLPIFALLFTALRIVLFLVRPTLLVLGVMKAKELADARSGAGTALAENVP